MLDVEFLKTIYRINNDLSLLDLQTLLGKSKTSFFNPHEYIIEEGCAKRELFFIVSGLVRSFKLKDTGEEITTSIIWENQFMGSHDTALFYQPSQFYFEALEPTQVLHIDFELLENILNLNPKLQHGRKAVANEIMRQIFRRLNSFILLSPEERYCEFIKENPLIVNRVPNKYIANLLGITPVSLSRIRKRISLKKQ
ncbi:MAG: Crp/Fnr family transcriptional regulator [Cytophagales bacterium]|nr:MAG: Crp/Fnr family transcriptional regulator [Cytophagales bacterium]